MDHEIGEGLHLGAMLTVAVAIGLFLVTIAGITRNGYVYRERDIIYNDRVRDTLIWDELMLWEDTQYGIANIRHVTDTDSALKFVTTHSDDYHWAVFMRNGTNTRWQCYTNTEFTQSEKDNLEKLPNITTCDWFYYNTTTLNSASTMIDTIYKINSERWVNDMEIKDYVRVFAYTHMSQISKNEEPLHIFPMDYTPTDLGFIVFIIY